MEGSKEHELIDTLWNVNKDAKKVILEYSAN